MSSAWLLALPLLVGGDPVPVRVDLRVELLTLVWRLIGASEFNGPETRSPYSQAIDEWFDPAREHRVCALAKAVRALRGISFNAVPDLAVHLSPLPELALRVPLEPWPERLDKRWQGADIEAFLRELRSFAQETGFLEFMDEHAELHRAAEAALARQVEDSRVLEWMLEFFGLEAGTNYVAIAGLLCGQNNFGASVRRTDGTLELWPVLGPAGWDADGQVLYDRRVISTVVHEFTHAFANPVIDAHWQAFESALGELYRPVQEVMAQQAYATPKIYAYEALVRACVTRHAARYGGIEGAQRQIEHEVKRGFAHTAALAELLGRYEAQRDQYATLLSFGPELARFFAARAAEAAPAHASSGSDQNRPASEPR